MSTRPQLSAFSSTRDPLLRWWCSGCSCPGLIGPFGPPRELAAAPKTAEPKQQDRASAGRPEPPARAARKHTQTLF